MLDVRKKLTSYLPSSARNHLQNVLTVEWDNNKTVLVDINGQADRTDDVELSGLTGNAFAPSRDRSEYGRLGDDEHDSDDLFNRPTLGKPRTSWTNATLYGTQGSSTSSAAATVGGRFRSGSSASRKAALAAAKAEREAAYGGYAAPPDLSTSSSSSGYTSQPSRQQSYRNESDNPFDENSPTYASGLAEADAAFEAEFRRPPAPASASAGGRGSNSKGQAQQDGGSGNPYTRPQPGYGASRANSGRMLPPRLDGPGGVNGNGGGYESGQNGLGPLGFGGPGPALNLGGAGQGAGGKNDPWVSGGWSDRTSPTSSRGTRGSAQLEDPFR